MKPSSFPKSIGSVTLSVVMTLLLLTSCSASRLDMGSLLSGAGKAVQAMTISDSQIQSYVHQYVAYSDQKNKVAPADSKYAQRLARLTSGLKSVDGVPLNFKVYMTDEINAFACADGSVRVYSGLMDRMTDDEVLGVIGHEIGHVAHKDTKNAFKNSLLTSALLDGVASTGSTAAALTNSQLGKLGESLVNAKFSQKQESNADDYGYDFLKSNGKNPWSMAMAFQKLGQLENSASSNGLQQMFSSHPSTTKRISHIAERCRKEGIQPPAG
ncbi:MAG: M48 family metallopeptidase, partial [Muribaculaceae bacterium]|nr:M48 family metallopeptidase [Muribaculaceae bacterium]